ncbi:hypothetical protein [Cellulosimicrobium cellulans]|uniref:hypothetical protein n=1 Tax=Cellulosimicrobium cellulans TaxID=1710 RepID=UPI00130E906F|nr:hypothetical protein [Cellulosimicrobium cellulans]
MIATTSASTGTTMDHVVPQRGRSPARDREVEHIANDVIDGVSARGVDVVDGVFAASRSTGPASRRSLNVITTNREDPPER